MWLTCPGLLPVQCFVQELLQASHRGCTPKTLYGVGLTAAELEEQFGLCKPSQRLSLESLVAF